MKKSYKHIEPIVHKSKNFQEAEKYDIQQHTQMSSSERQAAAKKLRERYFGKDVPDVRDSHQ
ncbi:MAG: hypothetical protein JXB26_04325 [Candidatus Aminicenantes bacterium]|nr:hypothetical protein [Candidatus Aminicenantes bacterium]